MKKSIVLICSILVVNLLLVGCSSVDGESSCSQDLTGELSTAESDFVGTWVLAGLVAENEVDLTDDNMSNPSTEVYSQLPECQKDVVYIFNSDRTFAIQQAYNVEGCPNKALVEGTWKLSAGQLTLVALCSSPRYNITLNTEVTVFTLEDTYNFNDRSGVIINSNVILTYERI